MTTDSKAITNARKVIEKFGGIRPMANTMNVPVTTVQGWKKRNVIPGNRRDDVLAAAASNNIDLGNLIDKGAANENAGTKPAGETAKSSGFGETLDEVRRRENPQAEARHETAIRAARTTEERETSLPSQEVLMGKLRAAERRAVQKSAIVTTLLVILAMSFSIFLLWPTAQSNKTRIATLEGDVAAIREDQGLLRRLIPQNLEDKFVQLQTRAQELQSQMQNYSAQADAFTTGVIGPDAGSISQRLERLEVIVAELGGSDQLTALIEKVQQLQQSVQGQEQLSRAVQEINAILAEMQGQMDNLNEELDQARQQDENLGETLEGVNQTDLKAAAMLLGLAQFRHSLNRSAPFAEDLALLQKMVGEDDPALNAAIERLAPQAEKGVLSPEGLSSEFKGLAGDIVVASLKGEDVTIRDKAKARLNEILQVEKNGELITGTDAQAAVARAQKALDTGDIKTAIAELQSLEGDAAATAQPWLEDAQVTLLAQQVQEMLTGAVMGRIGNRRTAPYSTGSGGLKGIVNELESLGTGKGKIYRDEESGITILPQ